MTRREGAAAAKTAIDDLALFGGRPAFANALHVGRPNLGDRRKFEERLGDVLDRRWLSNGGPYVQEFEQRLADLVGVAHCVATCNATVALEIAIRALGLVGEVIVPSFTFIATANALQWQAIAPVFCDVDPHTCTLDPRRVEALITTRTTGIIGVHTYGRPCDIDALADIAAHHGLHLLFDSAHALGCSYHGKMIGGFGRAEIFSFHATKFINALEGGAVATNDGDLARRIRLMKNFGFVGYDRTAALGINGKMNEVSAAMGLTNLEHIDELTTINRHNYRRYDEGVAGLGGLELLRFDERERCNYQYVVLHIDERTSGISRDLLVELLHREHVLARRYFSPCHLMEPYRSSPPYAGVSLPETERLAHRVVCLPTGTGVGEEDIDQICHILRLAIQHGGEITARMSTKSDRIRSISYESNGQESDPA